jgi:hypothetical protein
MVLKCMIKEIHFTLKLLLLIQETRPSINKPISSHLGGLSGEERYAIMSSPIKIFFLTSVVPSKGKNKSKLDICLALSNPMAQ